MYRLLGLRVLLGSLLFFAIFGGAIVSIIEQRCRRECPNLLWRASFAIAASVVTLAGVGLLIATMPVNWKHTAAIVMLSLLFVFGVWWTIHAKTYRGLVRSTLGEATILVSYALFSGGCLWLALATPNMPNSLPDGAYVSKELTRGVKIQYLTGSLPTDNALPLVVAEYFLRNISFHNNHPIMPAQEVSNRPVLAAAAVTPVLASVAPPPRSAEKLPTFSYVGIDWPDFRVLVRDDRVFAVYLAIMIPLNAAVLLGAAAFFTSFAKLESATAVAAAAIFMTSPYFVFQTIFTWPKELAAFFVLLAMALAPSASGLIVGAMTGLAYLSHPYAGAFLAGFSLYYLICQRKGQPLRQIVLLVIGFAIFAIPWLLWVHHLNLPSDLVTQNFIVPDQSLTDFMWIRLVNLLNTLLPVHLLVYPFDIVHTLVASTLNVAGAVGLVVYCVCLAHSRDITSSARGTTAVAVTLVPCLILVCVFSKPAVPAVHGLQVLMPLLIFAAAVQMRKYSTVTRTALVGAQASINLAFLTLYLYTIGVFRDAPAWLGQI